MLTPADVEKKTFSTALRGYDLDEVDDFLDEVVTTLRELTEELDEARAAAAEPSAVAAPEPAAEPAVVVEPEPAEAVVEMYKPEIDESAIGRALLAAQNAADRLLEEARSEADKIVDEAKTQADSWTAEREAKRKAAEEEIARLAARVASVRSELSVLAGEVSEKLDAMDSVIEDSVVTDIGLEDSDGGTEAGEELTPHAGVGIEQVAEGGDTDEGHDEGRGRDEPSDGPDHLDAMLTGVVNDLQLNSESESDENVPDQYHEESDRDERDQDE